MLLTLGYIILALALLPFAIRQISAIVSFAMRNLSIAIPLLLVITALLVISPLVYARRHHLDILTTYLTAFALLFAAAAAGVFLLKFLTPFVKKLLTPFETRIASAKAAFDTLLTGVWLAFLVVWAFRAPSHSVVAPVILAVLTVVWCCFKRQILMCRDFLIKLYQSLE